MPAKSDPTLFNNDVLSIISPLLTKAYYIHMAQEDITDENKLSEFHQYSYPHGLLPITLIPPIQQPRIPSYISPINGATACITTYPKNITKN